MFCLSLETKHGQALCYNIQHVFSIIQILCELCECIIVTHLCLSSFITLLEVLLYALVNELWKWPEELHFKYNHN